MATAIVGRRGVVGLVLLAIAVVAGGSGSAGRPGAARPGLPRAAATPPPGVAAVAHPARPEPATTWFAPYVDSTLTPTYQFQAGADDPARRVVLGFVVSDPGQPCTPSWGGYFTLPQAARALGLDRRVAQLEHGGGTAVISFGGEANEELALACHNGPLLQAAYGSVVARYGVTTLDFDIEGPALDDAPSIERRARALAVLQRSARAAGRPLAIWLTLPVATDGLLADGTSVISQTLRAGVDLAGVNVMTMDFGPSEPDMLSTIEGALRATHTQLMATYGALGTRLSPAVAWRRMGATVMIGRNDSPGEQVSTADASALVVWARTVHLGRVSMWSLNRDSACAPGSGSGVSDTCSGVPQTRLLSFNRIFAGVGGDMPAAPAGSGIDAGSSPWLPLFDVPGEPPPPSP